MLIMIDNYDSFTYNLVQYLGELSHTVEVYRNDEITISQLQQKKPKALILSPGPGRPREAGITLSVINCFKEEVPIFGVCLGHQAIAEAFGGTVVHAQCIMHGKTSQIYHDQHGIFGNIPTPFIATRYHSLAVEKKTLPGELMITAQTEDNEIMGLRHRVLPIEGVQFHPESILSQYGKEILRNFVREYDI